MLGNPSGVDSGATINKAEHLIDAANEFLGHGLHDGTKFGGHIGNGGDVRVLLQEGVKVALARDGAAADLLRALGTYGWTLGNLPCAAA